MPTHSERQKLLDAEREYFYAKSKSSLQKDDSNSADLSRLLTSKQDYNKQLDHSLDLDQLRLSTLEKIISKDRQRVKV